jgi:hypothetical protein
MSGSDCLRIAERLFASQLTRDNPLCLEIPESESVDELMATCAELGIVVEVAETKDQSEE